MKYAVMVFGEVCSPWYDTPQEAEDAIELLSPIHQELAEIVDNHDLRVV